MDSKLTTQSNPWYCYKQLFAGKLLDLMTWKCVPHLSSKPPAWRCREQLTPTCLFKTFCIIVVFVTQCLCWQSLCLLGTKRSEMLLTESIWFELGFKMIAVFWFLVSFVILWPGCKLLPWGTAALDWLPHVCSVCVCVRTRVCACVYVCVRVYVSVCVCTCLGILVRTRNWHSTVLVGTHITSLKEFLRLKMWF